MCFISNKHVTCLGTSLHCNNRSTNQSPHTHYSWSCCLQWAPGSGHKHTPCSPFHGRPHDLQAWLHLKMHIATFMNRYSLKLRLDLSSGVEAHWGSRSCRGPCPCTAGTDSGAKAPFSHSRRRKWPHWAGHSSERWTYASVIEEMQLFWGIWCFYDLFYCHCRAEFNTNCVLIIFLQYMQKSQHSVEITILIT